MQKIDDVLLEILLRNPDMPNYVIPCKQSDSLEGNKNTFDKNFIYKRQKNKSYNIHVINLYDLVWSYMSVMEHLNIK